MIDITGSLPGFTVSCGFTPFFDSPGSLIGYVLIGYVGPGAGLSMLGALLAVVCVIFLALLGPILYPIFTIRAWLRQRRERQARSVSPGDEGALLSGSVEVTSGGKPQRPVARQGVARQGVASQGAHAPGAAPPPL